MQPQNIISGRISQDLSYYNFNALKKKQLPYPLSKTCILNTNVQAASHDCGLRRSWLDQGTKIKTDGRKRDSE